MEINAFDGVKTLSCQIFRPKLSGEGGYFYMYVKRPGMVVGKFEINPQRRPIWTWLELSLTP